ncbi:hypothetical protein CBW65_01135 [Tumebacillus avium]|uniref:Gram-positive cocci surface proteins LPxTG domain-containing protein n=2 Tax=Tumebacillus avium TaxID=1903704 RepID=A0A1Y0IH60_9BACL|nr:hypothetical protein CBW65_01135 [Tumebacillus avium]
MLIFMLIFQIVAPGSSIAAGETDGLDLIMTTSKSVVKSGEVFDYKIAYSASSNIANFTNPRIRFTVPAGMTFASKSHSAAISSSYNSITKIVTFNFVGGVLPAGSSGELTVRAYFDNYVTLDGTATTAKATFDATVSGTPVALDSNEVTVTSHAEAKWTVTKEKFRPVVDPYKGNDVEYRITLKDSFPATTGRLAVENMVVTDTLPDGATFVSATQGGTLVGNTVVWSLGNLQNGTQFLNVTVNYPASLADATVTNRVVAEFKPLGQAPTSVSGEITHGFSTQPLDNGAVIEKWVPPALRERSPGQDFTFHISKLDLKANVPLTNVVIEDMTPTHTSTQSSQVVPIDLQLKTIKTAIFKDIPNYDVYYSTKADPGVWKLWQNVSGAVSSTLNVADLPLADSDRVAGVQFRIATVPVSAFQSTDFDLIYHIPSTFVVPSKNINVENVAKLTYTFNGSTKTVTDNTYAYIVDDRPLLELKKSSNKVDVQPSDVIEYTLKVKNTEYTSKSLDNPSIVDLLPPELVFNPGSAVVTTTDAGPAPKFEKTTEPDGTTLLNWYWDADNPYQLAIGEEVTIKFTATVHPATQSTTLANKMQVRSPHYLNDLSFKDLPCNTCGAGGYYTVESDVNVNVAVPTALQSDLLIKGELDNDWSKFPTVGKTTPGGSTMYRLEIQNVGSVPTKNLKIVNKFSRITDTGVRVTKPRGSQWGPLLTGEVTVPSYVTAFYSTTPDIKMDINGDDNGVWLETPPDDLTSVTAIKFQFDPDYVINPLNKMTLEWPMVAPVGAPTGGEVAWNSFAYKMDKATGDPLLPAEPKMVGVTIQASPKAGIGDFVWFDQNENGVKDGAETGINGIRLELRDKNGNKISETMTGNDFFGNPGAYLFPDLDPGEYVVAVLPPAGYLPDQTGVITVAGNQQHLTADFPLKPKKGKLGDTVWLDADGDGVQDAGESGENGVEVSLYQGGTEIDTTTTATIGGKDGVYLFEDLNPGTYEVRFTKPTGKKFTTPDTFTATLAQGEENMTLDAGLILSDASIGDFVWEDTNNNGLQDAGENGINLVAVQLYDDQDHLIDSTVTADRAGVPGYYAFEDLAAGNYYVKFILPFPAAKTAQGADRSVDSDANASGLTNVFTLAQSEHLTDIDAGYYKAPVIPPIVPPVIVEPDLPKGSIGDRVWIDANKNGVQDAGEAGQNGVTVELYNDKNQRVASTVTGTMNGKAGLYKFDQLAAGSYEVRFVLPSATVEFTAAGLGASRSLDSDANATTGRTGVFVLGIGEEKTSVDAGLVELGLPPIPPEDGEEPPMLKLGKIRSFVWFDLNANGVHDQSEQGMDGVTVELYDKAGKLIAKTKTKYFLGQHGFYEFLDLPEGDYSLKFIIPAGYGFTENGVGNDPNADSNPNPTGWTAPVTLGEGATELSIGAGLIKAAPPAPGKPGDKPSQPDTAQPVQPAPGATLPQTGEEPPVLPWIGLMLCLLAGGTLLYRKYA